MRYTNWLGQTVGEVGAYVCRGARDGNTSSFKIGIVEKVSVDSTHGLRCRVNWLFEPNERWRWNLAKKKAEQKGEEYTEPFPDYRRIAAGSSGLCGIDTLFLLDLAGVPEEIRTGFRARLQELDG